MEVDYTIYDDLPNNEELLTDEVVKLQAQNKELEAHIASLEADIEKLCARIVEMKKVQANLEKNISELYKTAKTELDRKDRIISDLRNQLDQYMRQGRPKISSVKRSREASPDSYDVHQDFSQKRMKRKCDDSRGRSRYSSSPKRNRSRSRSREHRYVYREKSRDRKRRDERTSSHEKRQGKSSNEQSSNLQRDSLPKSRAYGSNGEQKGNTTYKQKEGASKTSTDRTQNEKDANKKQVVENKINKVKNDKVGKEVTKEKVESVLENVSSVKAGETGKEEGVKPVENDTCKIITMEKPIVGGVMEEHLNASKVRKEEASNKKDEDSLQTTEKNKLDSEKIIEDSETELKVEKVEGNSGKSKYSALPVHKHVPNLHNATKRAKVSAKNKVEDTNKTCETEHVINEIKDNDNSINTGKNEKVESKLDSESSVKVDEAIPTSNTSATSRKAKEKGTKTKMDTLRIEDVTKKLKQRLVETKISVPEYTISSTFIESSLDQKETSPNETILNLVRTAAFCDDCKDSGNVNKNISDQENGGTSMKEVESACELDINTERVEEKVNEDNLNQEQKIQEIDHIDGNAAEDSEKGKPTDAERNLTCESDDKREKAKAVEEKAVTDKLNEQVKKQDKESILNDEKELDNSDKTVNKTDKQRKDENVFESQICTEVEMKKPETEGISNKEENKKEENDDEDKVTSSCELGEKAKVQIDDPKGAVNDSKDSSESKNILKQNDEKLKDEKKEATGKIKSVFTGNKVLKNNTSVKQKEKVSEQNSNIPKNKKLDVKVKPHAEKEEKIKMKERENDVNEHWIKFVEKCINSDEHINTNVTTKVPDENSEELKNESGKITKMDKNDVKNITDSKLKKAKDGASKKEPKEKLINNKKDKCEDEIPESDRVLRSATRRNSSKEKSEKSNDSVLDNQEDQRNKMNANSKTTNENGKKQSVASVDNSSDSSTINLTHEGEIPVLHLEDSPNEALNDSLFGVNLSVSSSSAITSTPMNKSHSQDKISSKIIDTPDAVNASLKSDSEMNASSECKVLNTSSARKRRRRVVITLID